MDFDEAQNLPPEFFRDFPAFLNFAFDLRDLISVWLVGHPCLAQTFIGSYSRKWCMGDLNVLG